MDYTDIKKGMVIKYDNQLWLVNWCQNHKPGKGGSIMRTKLKSLLKGTVKDRTFRGGDTIEAVRIKKTDAQLLYRDGDTFVFMDNETYDQIQVPLSVVDDAAIFLKDEMVCMLHIYEDEVIQVEPPMFVELEVIETDPGERGNTVSGGTKPATVEGGAVVQVPLFVNQGEIIKVDTRDSKYMERVK